MNSLIAEINSEITTSDAKIIKDEKSNQEIEEKLAAMEKEKDSYKEKIETLQQEYILERDEPIRLGKANENSKKAVDHLKFDFDKLVDETKVLDTN